jgi:glucose/arabinose dehydrogenase
VNSGGERGLLSMVFHPDFGRSRRVYVDYTRRRLLKLETVISEFTLAPGAMRVDAATERILLTIDQPYPNHNGGQLAFGPDGKLYIGMGDGGSANDPHDNGQRLDTLLGKILRIDVDAEPPYGIPRDNPFVDRRGVRPEIWAYGLRNPWRFSFDAATGRLWAADVGQDSREEIDVIERGKNYGWRITEGTLCTPGVSRSCSTGGLEPPVSEYGREEGVSVTGGFVYRGAAIRDLCGVYLHADYGSGRVWGLRVDGQRVTERRQLVGGGGRWSSFGEDASRELYIVDHRGGIYRIVPWERRTDAVSGRAVEAPRPPR